MLLVSSAGLPFPLTRICRVGNGLSHTGLFLVLLPVLASTVLVRQSFQFMT